MRTEKIAEEAAVDRYEFFKNSYFQQREYLINDGNMSEDSDLLEPDEGLDKDNLGPVSPY